MQEAAKRGRTVAEKLEEIVSAIFEFSLRNQELMRLQFATAFAASGEAPGGLRCREKGRRNFEFIKALIKSGQSSGELNKGFTVDELTMGIYGQLNSYIMVRLLMPDCPLDRGTAKRIVKLFLEGSAVSRSAANGGKKNGNGGARSGDVHVTVKGLRGRGRPRSLRERAVASRVTIRDGVKESAGEKQKWAAA